MKQTMEQLIIEQIESIFPHLHDAERKVNLLELTIDKDDCKVLVQQAQEQIEHACGAVSALLEEYRGW